MTDEERKMVLTETMVAEIWYDVFFGEESGHSTSVELDLSPLVKAVMVDMGIPESWVGSADLLWAEWYDGVKGISLMIESPNEYGSDDLREASAATVSSFMDSVAQTVSHHIKSATEVS